MIVMTEQFRSSPLWTEFEQRRQNHSLPDVALPASGEFGRDLSLAVFRFANCLLHPVFVTSVVELLEYASPDEVKLLQACTDLTDGFKAAPGHLVHLRNFWTANLERALFAREVARMLGVDTTLSFCAAFLQDVFLPLLSNQFYQEYVPLLDQQQNNKGTLAEAERRRFGWDHAQAAMLLADDPRFPTEFAFCLTLHHRAAEVVQDPALLLSPAAPVALSALLPDPLRQTPQGLQKLFLLSHHCEGFDLLDIAQRVDQSLNVLERRRLNHIPLQRRCQTWIAQRKSSSVNG